MASFLPFALLWWCWCTVLWILKHCSASKCRPPSSFCFPQLLTDPDWLTLLQVCVMHPFPPGLSPHTWKIAYTLFLTPPVRVWHQRAWDVPELNERPSSKSHMESHVERSSLSTFQDWISCKVHAHKKGQERVRKWQAESLIMSLYLITSQSHAEQYIHLFLSGVLGKHQCEESPICYLLVSSLELGPCMNVRLQPLNNLLLEYKSWDGMY